MTENIDLGILEHSHHADLIRALAQACYSDADVKAIWIGGSLAAGQGDAYSDIDFRIAVEPEKLEGWVKPKWERYLPINICGGTLLRFGDNALLHHLVLSNGTILDFYVQDTSVTNHEPSITVLACRDEHFAEALADFSEAPSPLTKNITADAARALFIDY